MKLQLKSRPSGVGSLVLQSTFPNETLSAPSELICSLEIHKRSPDLIWTAAALAFGPNLSGSYSESPEPNSHVFKAISEFLSPMELSVPTGRIGLIAPRSTKITASLRVPSSTHALRADRNEGVVEFCELSLNEWSGRLASLDRVFFASNFEMFGEVGSIGRLSAALAPIVLSAADWSLGRVIVSRSDWNGLNGDSCIRIQRLCAAVGILVCFEDGNKRKGE